VTSTTVSRSTPTHASSRTRPTITSTFPSGASTEAVPLSSVTATVVPQRNPQPLTRTSWPAAGRPSRRLTTTVSVPFKSTSSSSGDQSPIGVPPKRGVGCQTPRPGYFFASRMQYRCLKVRMKISPSDTAIDEFVSSARSNGFTASTSNFGFAASTTVSPVRVSR
jgi:hypothetical protein